MPSPSSSESLPSTAPMQGSSQTPAMIARCQSSLETRLSSSPGPGGGLREGLLRRHVFIREGEIAETLEVRTGESSTPTGTRTPVPWLRTKYPGPLDDGGVNSSVA